MSARDDYPPSVLALLKPGIRNVNAQLNTMCDEIDALRAKVARRDDELDRTNLRWLDVRAEFEDLKAKIEKITDTIVQFERDGSDSGFPSLGSVACVAIIAKVLGR